MTINKRDNKKFQKKAPYSNPYNILPSANILEEYENIAPGSVTKLIEMARKEQEHRHEWQDKHLVVHGKIHKWGQIFAFVYNLILLYAVWCIANSGNIDLALKLFVINACLMILALFVTFIERRVMNRRIPRKFPPKSPNYKGKK